MASLAVVSPSNPFDKLPIETTQHIAELIEYDVDLCNFRLVCRSTHDAVDADNCSFWRRRFLASFEKPMGGDWAGAKGNLRFRQAYKRRKDVLKNGALFRNGRSKREEWCFEVLKELILDAFSEKTEPAQTYESLNLTYLKRFVVANNLLKIFEPPKAKTSRFNTRRAGQGALTYKPSELMKVIQIICAPMLLSFEPSLLPEHYGYPESQRIVYSTAKDWPIFSDIEYVNMDFVLHNINFWKYHMLRQAEHTLFSAFSDLDADDRPRWWDSRVMPGKQTLGKHWKGSYAFVQREEIVAMRSGHGEDEQIQDIFAGEDDGGAFQHLCLELTGDDEDIPWPTAFERVLRSKTQPGTRILTRAQRRSAQPEMSADVRPQAFHFEGEGKDVSEQFLASGYLNPLPGQEGVPGWQRMTMMKYFANADGSMDMEGLWAYEGVVLPGGQIIVGRWWSPTNGADEEVYSGPFILWCVDGPKYVEQDQKERAVAMAEADDGWA